MNKALKWSVTTLALLAVALAGAVQLGSSSSAGPCAEPAPSGAFTVLRLRTVDSNCLQAYAWLPSGQPVAGAAVLVHGLFDHARRYQALAEALNAKGVAVYALDLRGHGGSGGARQRLDSMALLVGDAELLLQESARRHPGVPLFVYGHSLGGMVAAHVVANNRAALRGAVISSAALKLPVGASAGTVRVVGALAAVAPGLGLEAVDEAALVRDPAARAALAADPHIIRAKLPARTVATLFDGATTIQARMDGVQVPLLVLHGKDDRVTDPQGSSQLAARAAMADKTLRLYEGMLHDLLHEPVGAEVAREIAGFVSTRLTAKP